MKIILILLTFGILLFAFTNIPETIKKYLDDKKENKK